MTAIYHAQKATLYMPTIGLNKFKPADPSKMINHFLNESLSVSLKSSMIASLMIACSIYHAQKVTLSVQTIGLNKFKPADPSKMINHFLNESL